MFQSYHLYLESNLNRSEFLTLFILVELLQIHKWVRLETLAVNFPLPIKFESRRKRLQRFFSSPKLNIERLWHPILKEIVETYYPKDKTLYLVIDRTRWKGINILIVSLLYKKRAIPLYFQLLNKKGNSNVAEQITIIEKVIHLFNEYNKIVLGDREFCGVELAKWLLTQEKTDFCLRVKKNEYLKINEEMKVKLKDLNLSPGTSFYYQGVKLTKTKGFGPVNIIGKWKKNYRNKKAKEPWFIMTNLDSYQKATAAYAQRMGIEEMFRDWKKGGYNLESTGLKGHRLISLVLVMTLAYTEATLSGNKLQKSGKTNYIGRTKEKERSTKRHSDFYLGLHGKDWLTALEYFVVESQLLMLLAPQKRRYYQKGLRAVTIAKSAF